MKNFNINFRPAILRGTCHNCGGSMLTYYNDGLLCDVCLGEMEEMPEDYDPNGDAKAEFEAELRDQYQEMAIFWGDLEDDEDDFEVVDEPDTIVDMQSALEYLRQNQSGMGDLDGLFVILTVMIIATVFLMMIPTVHPEPQTWKQAIDNDLILYLRSTVGVGLFFFGGFVFCGGLK